MLWRDRGSNRRRKFQIFHFNFNAGEWHNLGHFSNCINPVIYYHCGWDDCVEKKMFRLRPSDLKGGRDTRLPFHSRFFMSLLILCEIWIALRSQANRWKQRFSLRGSKSTNFNFLVKIPHNNKNAIICKIKFPLQAINHHFPSFFSVRINQICFLQIKFTLKFYNRYS